MKSKTCYPTHTMRIALVHELLTMKGGAERVFRTLTEQYPDAPIYTLLYNEKKMGDWFPRERVRGFIKPLLGYNHHNYLKLFPARVESWDFSEYDLVISSSSAFVHGIITNGKPRHICYVHSPARYLWDRTHDVLARAPWYARYFLECAFHKLRMWDSESSERADVLIAPSKEVQRRIELYWRRESTVIHPPIDDMFLKTQPQAVNRENPDYFLVVSTLAKYKRIDLAIAACEKLGKHLIVVGEGADMPRLKKLAGPNTEFYGRRDGQELIDLYGGAQAVLFPGEEDFGLVPLEAMACGTPVIAYRKGGALETVTEGVTGMFFDEPTSDSLAATIGRFSKASFSKDTLKAAAASHSSKAFLDALERVVGATEALPNVTLSGDEG